MNSNLVQLVYNDIDNNQVVLKFQSTTSFSGNNTSTITTYPTSEGTPKSDNIYNNPNTFTVSVQVGGSENITDEWGIGTERPKNASNILFYLKDYAIPLTIITPQYEYYNMFLTGINLNNSTNNAYDFSAGLTFSELFIATFETIQVGPFEDAVVVANDSSSENNGNNDEEQSDAVTDVFTGVGSGLGQIGGLALSGAAIGSAIAPGIGTAIGGFSGAVVGLLVHLLDVEGF